MDPFYFLDLDIEYPLNTIEEEEYESKYENPELMESLKKYLDEDSNNSDSIAIINVLKAILNITGIKLNDKDEMKIKLGEEKVHKFRRSWDNPPKPLNTNSPYHPKNISIYNDRPSSFSVIIKNSQPL